MSRRFLIRTTVHATLGLSLAAPALSALSALSALLAPRAAFAQDVPPEIATARNSAVAQVNADGVYIRSGAGDNYYPTTKLNKGTDVTVVGAKFDWLKIVPPQGSFSYVAKAFVDKQADGKTGVVNRDDVNVRAGSELNAMKTTVQGKLSNGQQVKILEEVDEYYKIAPPADAFVYVNKQFVSAPAKIVAAAPGAGGAGQQGADAATAEGAKTQASDQVAGGGGDFGAAGGATTQPSGEVASGPATTQPTNTAEVDFDKLENDFNAASAKPIEQQPLDQLTADYQKLIANPQLPESMRRVADFRVQTLKIRQDTKAQFVTVQKQQQEAKAKQQALKAEQEEIAQQIKQTEVKVFAAVGTLRTSSLQQGDKMLYRLTDPDTGRTVCYVRTDDPKVGASIGQFVGVKGDIATEASLNMKVISPSEWQQVDPNQLYRGVAAQIVPPSMLPRTASATEK